MPTQNADTNANRELEDNLDKVREILFGARSRTQDERMEAMAKRLQDESARATRRVEQLEVLINQTTQSLAERIASQHIDTKNSTARLRDEQLQTAATLEARIEAFESRMMRVVAEMRQQIDHQAESLRAELKQYRSDAARSIEAQRRSLEERSVNRVALANMLSRVVSALHHQDSNTGLR